MTRKLSLIILAMALAGGVGCQSPFLPYKGRTNETRVCR